MRSKLSALTPALPPPSSTRTIGMFLQLAFPSAERLIAGAESFVHKAALPWRLVLFDAAHYAAPGTRLPALDGALASGLPDAVASKKHFPAVLLQGDGEGAEGWDDVLLIDHGAPVHLAVRHLCERGLTDLAFVGYPSRSTPFWCQAREQAFLSATAGCASRHVFPTTAARERSREALLDHLALWLGSLPTPVGIVAADDFRGLDLLHAALRAGRSIPEEIAVVSIGNHSVIASRTDPALTSVGLNLEAAAAEAARLLAERLQRPGLPCRQLRFSKPRLHMRASTDVLAVRDSLVLEAIEWIKKHLQAQIGPAEVAAALQVSPGRLDAHFQSAMHCSVARFVQNSRMECARRLLVESDEPIKAVAHQVGYQTPQYFARIFHQRNGQSPGEYRQAHSKPSSRPE